MVLVKNYETASLKLLKVCGENCTLFFPDTVYMLRPICEIGPFRAKFESV